MRIHHEYMEMKKQFEERIRASLKVQFHDFTEVTGAPVTGLDLQFTDISTFAGHGMNVIKVTIRTES